MNGATATIAPVVDRRVRRNWTMVAVLFAVLAGVWCMRSSLNTATIDTDAARHAMNGAFVYDMVRDGGWIDPIPYARAYYSRLPGLSLPYHPPVFPAFEALVFSIFGVSVFSARLAVAICVTVSILLLFSLVLRTHHSPSLALAAALGFLAINSVQIVATDVMLEFPALVFVLCAMHALATLEETDGRAGGIQFGLAAAAAIWTKQAIFLGLAPFVYILLTRRWRWLRSPALWIGASLTAASALALAAVAWSIGWSGMNETWAKLKPSQILLTNVSYYAAVVAKRPQLAIAVLACALVVVITQIRFGVKRVEGNRIYWSWAVAVLIVLLASPAYSERYLIFAYPAVIVVAATFVDRISGRLLRARHVPLFVAVIAAAATLPHSPKYLRGPDEVARFVAQSGSRTAIYFGLTDGNFIFSLRSIEKAPRTNVIRGEKLPRGLLTEEALLQFARRYGAGSIVLERSHAAQPWDSLFTDGAARIVPMTSSEPRLRGELRVVQVKGVSTNPDKLPPVPSNVLGREIQTN
jgi:4-amino-4-deoxy-L-arabinose transferase-like glycosyltransferase